jgi:hypothetical protein
MLCSSLPVNQRFRLLATCFMLVPCFAYSSTLKMEANIRPKHRLTFKGLHRVISQQIELLMTIAK